MRKHIQSNAFVELLATDIKALKTAKQQLREAKKQAKARINDESIQLTKDEKKSLKIEYIRAKIRYKAAKHAWKAAHKVVAPYLVEEVLGVEKEEKKKVKHKKDEAVEAKATKPIKVKKAKKGAKNGKVIKAQKQSKTIVAVEDAPIVNVEEFATVKTIKTTVKSEAILPTASDSIASTISKTPQKPDDLTLIEGIGPKTAEVLSKNGIFTFKQLSLMATDYIKDVLQKNNLRLADPSTWAEQARLATEGKMEALETLKKELKGGKRA